MLKAVRRLFRRSPPAGPPPAATPPNVQALFEAPSLALAAGHLDEAVRLLEAVLAMHPGLAEAHLLLGTVFHQRGEIDEARDSFLLAAHFSPKSWLAHFRLGLVELEQGRCVQAIECLERALPHCGGNARNHNALGACFLRARAPEKAAQQFRQAIALDSQFGEGHSNLGTVLFSELEEYTKGAAHIETALALEPARVETRLNWAMVLQLRGEIEEALAIYDDLIAADPGLAEARVNRALVRLTQGDYARAWADYEARKSLGPAQSLGTMREPEWDGSNLSGQTLAVYGEQGIGDEILFASCLPEVIEAAQRCIVRCNPKLVRLFRRSFPEAIVFAAGPGDASARAGAPRADWSASIGSLPGFLRNAPGDFPSHRGYLRGDPARVQHWRSRLALLSGRLKVGISWRGGAPSTRRNLRSIPLDQWRRLLGFPGVDFVSLQYTDCSEEIALVADAAGRAIHYWHEAIEDYDETAALVSALDLVISVQTSAVHLAGALGVPTWALIAETPEWRYGREAETMPWYPSVRLVRKAYGEDWTSVLTTVEKRLASAVMSHGPLP